MNYLYNKLIRKDLNEEYVGTFPDFATMKLPVFQEAMQNIYFSYNFAELKTIQEKLNVLLSKNLNNEINWREHNNRLYFDITGNGETADIFLVNHDLTTVYAQSDYNDGMNSISLLAFKKIIDDWVCEVEVYNKDPEHYPSSK